MFFFSIFILLWLNPNPVSNSTYTMTAPEYGREKHTINNFRRVLTNYKSYYIYLDKYFLPFFKLSVIHSQLMAFYFLFHWKKILIAFTTKSIHLPTSVHVSSLTLCYYINECYSLPIPLHFYTTISSHILNKIISKIIFFSYIMKSSLTAMLNASEACCIPPILKKKQQLKPPLTLHYLLANVYLPFSVL